jgi:predicted nicotinamide N-methyase
VGDARAELARRYDLIETTLRLAGRELVVTHVRDINALVDAIDDLGPDERLPYFATLWPAAEGLAEALLAAPPAGPVIELGCGLGLGAVAAALGGADVLATDWEPDALELAAHNAEQNGVRIRSRLCDWRDWSGAADLAGAFAAVIGADLLYEARNADPVARSIAYLLGPGGVATICDPGRPYLAGFIDRLTDLGFMVNHTSVRGCELVRAERGVHLQRSGFLGG